MGCIEKIKWMALRRAVYNRFDGGLGRGCGPVLIGMLLLLLLIVSGCSTWKHTVDEKTEKEDSVRIEIVEKIVEVPVTVTVEVPAQQKERETPNDSSYLETDFARSWAKLRWKGDTPYLFHSLENIPKKIEKTDSVPVLEKTKTVWKTRRVSYTKTVIREKKLSTWQKFLMYSGGVLYAIIIIVIVLKVSIFRGKKVI